MEETPTNVRSRRDIKESLLKKAFKEGRGPEVISEIMRRLNLIQDMPPQHKEVLEETRHIDDGQPRGVRALNARARHDGEKERYVHTDKIIAPAPPTVQ